MNQKNLILLALAVGAYFYFSKGSTASGQYQFCQFPDGTIVKVPLSANCPSDPAHGGQSVFLATATG